MSQTSCFANVLISRLHSSRLAGHMTQESEPTCLCFLMQCVSHNRFSPLCVAVRYGSELRARLYGYGWMQSARAQCPGPPQAEATCYTKLMFSRTSLLGHGCIHRLTLDCSTALGVQEAIADHKDAGCEMLGLPRQLHGQCRLLRKPYQTAVARHAQHTYWHMQAGHVTSRHMSQTLLHTRQ